MQRHVPLAPRREPALNVPKIVLVVLAVLALIHAVRATLPDDDDLQVLLWFAFIPARYDPDFTLGVFPGGLAADVWTFVTYALLHGNLTHLVLNAIWIAAFGSAVARRFGTARFLLFCAVTAAAGAAAHLFTHFGELVPTIGASAAVSGLMGAAVRFVFGPAGGSALRQGSPRLHAPALSLREAFRIPAVLGFVGVWFGLNLLTGIAPAAIPGIEGAQVAWQAHIGGFAAGLFLFRLFDPPSDRAAVLRAGHAARHDGRGGVAEEP